jgi:hypothetical protein
MSDHNPSDSFDNHPENSGCSNDDFEQVDVPGSAFYHDNGDADGPDDGFVGSHDVYGFHYDQDEQGAEVSTTTRPTSGEEDEAEADRYAAGASEAEAYGYAPDEADVDDALAALDTDSFEFERHDQEQPSDHVVPDTETDLQLHASAPAPDILEQANTYASSTAADILSTIAQSASPPSGHYKDYEEPISSTVYDDDDDAGYDIEDEEREQEQQISDTEHEQQAFEKEHEHPEQRDLLDLTPERYNFEVLPVEEATAAACFIRQPTPELVKEPELITYAEPALCTSSTDILAEKDSSPAAPSSKGTAGGCFLKSIDPRVKDLIYWRDVKKSGVVFGGLLVLLVALALLSIISVVAYLSLTALAITFSFVIYKKVTGAVRKSTDGHPFSCLLDREINLNEDKLKPVIQTVLRKVNAVAQELRHLFLIEDTVDSIKFGVLLWALTYIGSWFSDLALIITVTVLVFTVPKLYETYQVQIDNYVGLAKAQINTYLSIIQSKVPFLKRKEKAH